MNSFNIIRSAVEKQLTEDRKQLQDIISAMSDALTASQLEILSIKKQMQARDTAITNLVNLVCSVTEKVAALQIGKENQVDSIINIHNRVCEQVTTLNSVMSYLESEQGWERK